MIKHNICRSFGAKGLRLYVFYKYDAPSVLGMASDNITLFYKYDAPSVLGMASDNIALD